MKPFDIELAKAGHPVRTRDGKPVRIICYDRISEANRSIVGLVKEEDDRECVYFYYKHGRHFDNGLESDVDLVMAPRERWVNVLRHKLGDEEVAPTIYETKEIAESYGQLLTDYYETVKIKLK